MATGISRSHSSAKSGQPGQALSDADGAKFSEAAELFATCQGGGGGLSEAK